MAFSFFLPYALLAYYGESLMPSTSNQKTCVPADPLGLFALVVVFLIARIGPCGHVTLPPFPSDCGLHSIPGTVAHRLTSDPSQVRKRQRE